MKKHILFFIALFIASGLFSQEKTQDPVYEIKWLRDGLITGGAAAANYVGLSIVINKPRLDTLEALSYRPNDVNWFDRPATMLDPALADGAQTRSDLGLSISFFLPAALALDKKIRKDFAKIMLLYLETGFITGAFYSWGAAMHIDRVRPLVHNPEEPLSRKLQKHLTNSFYSGHVASSAAATFFMAKVISDYHPELGNKKVLVYGAAALLPAFVGVNRYLAGKHFTTDILTGFAIGALGGILIPHLHKPKADRKLTLVPLGGNFQGLGMTYRF